MNFLVTAPPFLYDSMNGGTCTNSDGSYLCTCTDAFRGDNCDMGQCKATDGTKTDHVSSAVDRL